MIKSIFSKVKGSIFDMPIDAASVANVLRYGADSIGLIILKLKPETKLPWSCIFRISAPRITLSRINFLKQNNVLDKDVDN